MTHHLNYFDPDTVILGEVLDRLHAIDKGDYSNRFQILDQSTRNATILDRYDSSFTVHINSGRIWCDDTVITIQNPGNAFEVAIKLTAWLRSTRPRPHHRHF